MIQTGPEVYYQEVESIDADAQALLIEALLLKASTIIAGQDLPLEETITNMSGILAGLGMKIEIASWRNIVPNVWCFDIFVMLNRQCVLPTAKVKQRKCISFCAG